MSIVLGPVGDTVGTTVDTIGANATVTASVTAATGTNPSVGIERNEEKMIQRLFIKANNSSEMTKRIIDIKI